ncbi:hypothetical protein [Stratiformator vulcanicus]|uniref:Uncharacterized protein n=1 Tax=Stratiformator vulcanicus TaxID=2527980 RepID=A0A517QWQ8_9PLAN|nr:hypothetical protein [Stratiformator vulcanicus]QDT36099.1 hypothetical protein Pan189_04540 [Stratiformator vulcanicus]
MRRILHSRSGSTDFTADIAPRAVSGCWFDWHRGGGCGAGELRFKDGFLDRNSIDAGDWFAVEDTSGVRWYFGRVESVVAESPAGAVARLSGMSSQLNHIFPGGFRDAVDSAPYVIGVTDPFAADPDHGVESFDTVGGLRETILTLLNRFVVGPTDIAYDSASISVPAEVDAVAISSLKFRGEESLRAIFNDLAVRARQASWGVDADGQFYFREQPSGASAVFREGRDSIVLSETRDTDLLFNRILLTGGYVYRNEDVTWSPVRDSLRWRGHYVEPNSRAKFGDRQIEISVPWIRTSADADAFAREFFRTYAAPTVRHIVEVGDRTTPLFPWLGRFTLQDRNGDAIATAAAETVRVFFDHALRLRLELGPPDPRELWPEPDRHERWETPRYDEILFSDEYPGGEYSLFSFPDESFGSGNGSGGSGSSGGMSTGNGSSGSVSSDAVSSDFGSSDMPSSDAFSSDWPSSDFGSSDASGDGTSLPPSSDAGTSLPSSSGNASS